MTSLRKIASNQKNSLKSTGPKTKAGKEKSRRNALKHGLAGEGLVLPDEEMDAVLQREAEWNSSLRPFNPFEIWLAQRICTESVRIDVCTRKSAMLRTRVAHRASDCWDDDQRADAEALAVNLARRPELVARRLAQTSHGCDWLIERWEALAEVLDRTGTWDDPKREIALNLLGVPRDFRDGPTALDPPTGVEVKTHLAALVRTEAARLIDRKISILDDLDAEERAAAMLGQGADHEANLKRLERYEAACTRRLQWALERLRNRSCDTLPPRPPGNGSRPDSRDPSRPPPDPAITERFKTLFPNVYGQARDLEPRAEVPPLDLFAPLAPRPTPVGNRRQRRAQRSLARRAG